MLLQHLSVSLALRCLIIVPTWKYSVKKEVSPFRLLLAGSNIQAQFLVAFRLAPVCAFSCAKALSIMILNMSSKPMPLGLEDH